MKVKLGLKVKITQYLQNCTGDKINSDTCIYSKYYRSGCNAVAFWMEWNLDDENIISTGLTEKCEPGKAPKWDWYSRQGVYFVPTWQTHVSKCTNIQVNALFCPKSGNVEISVKED